MKSQVSIKMWENEWSENMWVLLYNWIFLLFWTNEDLIGFHGENGKDFFFDFLCENGCDWGKNFEILILRSFEKCAKR